MKLLYSCFLRLVPVAGGFIGWRISGWLGMVIGIILGCLLAVSIWGIAFSIGFKRRLRNKRVVAEKLSTEELQKIATDPTSSELAFAMGELAKRGFNTRPSVESILELLPSPDSQRRVLGLTLLFGLYPNVFAKIQKDWSSADAPEVWRERIATLGEPH